MSLRSGPWSALAFDVLGVWAMSQTPFPGRMGHEGATYAPLIVGLVLVGLWIALVAYGLWELAMQIVTALD